MPALTPDHHGVRLVAAVAVTGLTVTVLVMRCQPRLTWPLP